MRCMGNYKASAERLLILILKVSMNTAIAFVKQIKCITKTIDAFLFFVEDND